MVIYMYIYPRMRDLREDHDITQAELAQLLGTHTTQYRRWEIGETEVPTHILKKLCTFYNISADYMIGFTNTLKQLPKE